MLDDLYGPGSWEAMQACFAVPAGTRVEIEQVETPDGGVRVTARWWRDEAQVGQGKVDCFPGRAHFVTLDLGDAQRSGITTKLAGDIGDLFEARGVSWVTVSPRDEASARVFERTGAVRRGDGAFGYQTEGDGQRRKQYAAWKAGKATEPDWHVGL